MTTTDTDPRRPLTIIVNAPHGGGAEFVGRTWAYELHRQGFPIRLLAIDPIDDNAQQHVHPEILQLIEVPGGTNRWARYRRLRALLQSANSSAVVTLQMRPNLLVLLLSMTVRRRDRATVAISERNIVSVFAGQVTRGHRMRVWLARRLYGRADRMLAISHPVAAEMIAGFGVDAERCRVVPNPASSKRALVGTPDESIDGALALVVVGRLAPQKRPLLAVEVAAELRDRGVPTRLVVFGDGPLRQELEAAALKAGVSLDLRGWVEAWPAACPPNSVLLLASMKEGFGNVLVEAAVQRIPSVATSQALGVADAIVPGVTGILAIDSFPTSLANAVLAARSCQFGGTDDWLERFTPARSAQALLDAVEPRW